jgi:hypothetical protein
LIYSFGKDSSAQFTAGIGTFNVTAEASVDGGVKQSSVDFNRITTGNFKCASKSLVPSCLAKLKSSGIFGSLTDSVYLDEINVRVEVSGRIEYDWRSIDGNSNKRSSPFSIAIPLLQFDIGGPECGAPAPVDRHDKPITLALDKNNYRISLDWRGQLMSRQNKRFTLSLSAPKSSHHFAKVVLELSDGSTIASMPMDILYFTPRMPPPPKQ